MEGYLKQKMQGLDGILCWRRRHFALDPRKGWLTVTDDVDDIVNGAGEVSTVLNPRSDAGAKLSVTRISLEGARRAVAWSGIDAFNGCVFDVIWATGRVWSILCDDSDIRKSWVDALNNSIRDSDRNNGSEPSAKDRRYNKDRGDLGSPHEHPPLPPRPRSEDVATQQRFFPVDSTSPSVRNNGISCSRNERGNRLTRSDLSSSGYWTGENWPLQCGNDQSAERLRQRRRCRYQELGLRSAIPGAVCAAPEAPQWHGGVADSTTKAREFDNVEGFNGVGKDIFWKRECGDSERSRRDKSRAREKSEQLAKASAATWGQFQRLLEKSRESKARYDKIVDEAAESGARMSKGRQSDSEEDSGNTRNSVSASKQHTESKTTTASSSIRRHVDSSSPNGSSTKQYTISAAASCVGGFKSDYVSREIPAVKTTAVQVTAGILPKGCDDSDLDPAGQSRLSRVTEVETSFLRPRREMEDDNRSSVDGSIRHSRSRKAGANGRRQRRRKKLSVAPEKTKDVLVSRLRLLEADLESERREAAATARAETRLRHELAKSESERQKLEGQVATIKSTAEKDIKATISRAFAEREIEMQYREEGRLKASLEAAKKAEKKRDEVVKQKEELERALAAEIGERRRVSNLLKECSISERLLRERLEATEGDGDLKARLASTRAELDAVRREKDSLAKALDRCISHQGDQAKEMGLALRSKQQREIADISSRHEIEKEEMREQLFQEAEDRVREDTRTAIAMQEKKLRAEAAEAAHRKAELSEKKLREVRAEADAAGEATRKDIEKLRRLHAKRVHQLEALLKEETDNLADARREIAICKTTLAGDAGEFQRWTEEQRDQSSRLLEELGRIQKRVDKAVEKETASREREGLAMNRLRKAMEEARLERAEGIELRRQLREALAELESNQNAQARRARSDIRLQRATEIAQQEVAMLEAERSRWNEERRSMETALDRLKRLVYGASTTSKPTTASSKGRTRTIPAASVKNASGAISEGRWRRAY